ncbi:hypothetical protein H0H93_005213 [Arthromyces matolae]|nr:hypothetical protein H0H93_005213 [Arthromyces matolae]
MSMVSSSIGFPNLEKLSLLFPSNLLEIILRSNFPWHQLTSFTIGGSDGSDLFENLPLLFNTLHLSTRLVNLQIQFGEFFPESEPLRRWENDPIKLPFLQNLKVDWDRQFPMINHLISASNLRSLDAGELSLSNFYFVVRQCPRLVELISAIKTRIPDLVSSEPSYIVLPCLKRLDLSFNDEWSPSSFPTLLTLPGLDSLDIFILGAGSFPLDLVFDLINRSNARLSRIHGRVNRHTSLEPAESVLSLLTALEGASHVDLTNVTFPQTVLDLIAAGSLLPHLESLRFGASTLEQGLSMIESRLRYEESCGGVKLKRSVGFITHSPTENRANGAHRIDMARRELTRRYGVQCDFDYVD